MAELSGVPRVRGLNEQRRARLADRLSEQGEEGFREAIAAVGRSDFCRGKNDRKWRADFDFVVQAKNFLRLMEGSFDAGEFDQEPASQIKDPETKADLERAIAFNEDKGFPDAAERHRRNLQALMTRAGTPGNARATAEH